MQQLKGESASMTKKIELIQLSQRKLLGHGLSSCNLDELHEIDSQLERSLHSIRARKAQLMMEQIEHLKSKERLLREENAKLSHKLNEKEVVTYGSQSSQSSDMDVETALFIGLPERRCS
uniref:K-box domain-containing protein n=1 Tax=Fagus sylvatica TaxID=28930 RepID=A0A2N9FV08_FAGSY